jgi:hypothetical protein
MHSWLSAFILCREAGIHAGFPREYDDWSEVPLLLTPVPAGDSWGYHLYTPFWQRVRPYVEAGATLYASLSAASALSIPDVVELFGVNLADRAFWRPEVKLTFDEDFFGIRAGEVFEFSAQPGLQSTGVMLNVHDARVLARDHEGNPALLVHEVGQGHAVLCAYPIELMLGRTPNALEGRSNYWRLYRALKRLAGIQSLFSVDQPEVEVGCLTGKGRAYVIIVNHTPGTVSGNVVASHEGEATRIRPEGTEFVAEAGDTWPFELPGFTGALFEWRRLTGE